MGKEEQLLEVKFLIWHKEDSLISVKTWLFLERWGREGERGRETSMWGRNIDQFPLTGAPTGDLTCNPGLCPDRESQQWPFTLWGNAPPIEPHGSGRATQIVYCEGGTDQKDWKHWDKEEEGKEREKEIQLVISDQNF